MSSKISIVTGSVAVEFPLLVVSEANTRGHWGKRHRRSSNQQNVVGWELAASAGLIRMLGFPLTVTLTLIKGGTPLDDDNLRGALKAVRDSVAKTIGVNDADARVTWWYSQDVRAELKRQRRVRIEIVRRPTCSSK